MIDVKEKTKKEIDSFLCEYDFRIATIGTTMRESLPFAILPRRKAFSNDTTLEVADMFLRHYFHDYLKEKRILIYEAGDLGSKFL